MRNPSLFKYYWWRGKLRDTDEMPRALAKVHETRNHICCAVLSKKVKFEPSHGIMTCDMWHLMPIASQTTTENRLGSGLVWTSKPAYAAASLGPSTCPWPLITEYGNDPLSSLLMILWLITRLAGTWNTLLELILQSHDYQDAKATFG